MPSAAFAVMILMACTSTASIGCGLVATFDPRADVARAADFYQRVLLADTFVFFAAWVLTYLVLG